MVVGITLDRRFESMGEMLDLDRGRLSRFDEIWEGRPVGRVRRRDLRFAAGLADRGFGLGLDRVAACLEPRCVSVVEEVDFRG